MFEGDWKLRFHLAPPLLERPDPVTGEPKKRSLRPVDAARLPRLLARLKRLRGTRLDPFGYTADRRAERQLIPDYEALIEEILQRPDAGQAMPPRSSWPRYPTGSAASARSRSASSRTPSKREAELLEAFRARGQARERGGRRPAASR